MNDFSIFSDISCNHSFNYGLGAYAFVPNEIISNLDFEITKSSIQKFIHYKSFENHSSSRLELQTLLYALKKAIDELNDDIDNKITVYTDSQSICGLLARRKKLEIQNFVTKSTQNEYKNADLYKTFYKYHDTLKFDLVKVIGHQPKFKKDRVHQIFSIIDQEVRKKLKHLNIQKINK